MDEFRKVEHLGAKFKVNRQGKVYVWKYRKNEWEEAKQKLNKDGYPYVSGYNPIKQRCATVCVHILVAKAFIPNPENLPEVNHKDYNRANPDVDNLGWVTHGDNVRYSSNAGRYSQRVGELNPNYGNKTLHNKYLANKEYAKEKQSRPGKQNGRAKRCELKYNGAVIGIFSYLRQAVYYLYDNNLLPRRSHPESHIQLLKRPEGYMGYQIIVI